MQLMFEFLREFSDVGLLFLRLALGAVFLVHGIDKLAMWKMQPSEQMPAPMIKLFRLLSIVEPLGGAAMMAGFLTPLAAIGFMIIMLGAIGVKMNVMKLGFITSMKVGWDFDLMNFASAAALLVLGPGAFSVDAYLFLAK